MEVRLGCRVEAIHVPGRVIVVQGTDGLSRGVWISPLHAVDPISVTASVFAGCVPSPLWCSFLHHRFALPTQGHLRHWSQCSAFELMIHRHTVWLPPPELARQVLSEFLLLWVESPWDTSAVFVIPRVLRHQWSRLSRCLLDIGELKPEDLPPVLRPSLPIPVVVLYLPCYNRCLTPVVPSSRALDESPFPEDATWHREQADYLRGL
jgi:hypothetical protein